MSDFTSRRIRRVPPRQRSTSVYHHSQLGVPSRRRPSSRGLEKFNAYSACSQFAVAPIEGLDPLTHRPSPPRINGHSPRLGRGRIPIGPRQWSVTPSNVDLHRDLDRELSADDSPQPTIARLCYSQTTITGINATPHSTCRKNASSAQASIAPKPASPLPSNYESLSPL
jgi:hypothetical protein